MTTNMIRAELVPLLDSRARIARQAVIAYVEHVRTSPYITIIHVDEAIDQAGWDMLKQYSDKSWSLVDAISFVVMRRFGIGEALTTDHHSEQAGFTCLPARRAPHTPYSGAAKEPSVMPPSTTSTVPVVKLAAGEAR